MKALGPEGAPRIDVSCEELEAEWLTSGAAVRRPAIPAPGSALGSHPCVATILRPGEASIPGMARLGHTNQKLLAAAATDAVQQSHVLAAARWPVLR